MAKTAVVRARIEPKLKEHVETLLADLGVKPSEAINMFYHQVQRTGRLPFEINTNQASQERDEDMRRLEDCRAGNFIPHDQVDAWLRSIGTEHELPCPTK